MRILFVSNFFPPTFIGGYELGCSRVVEELKRRGHACHVLTSTYSDAASCQDVTSRLRFCLSRCEPRRLGRLRTVVDDQVNRREVRTVIAAFRPEVIHIWNPMLLSPGVLYEAIETGVPNSFFVSDEWPTVWQTENDVSGQRLAEALEFGPARALYYGCSRVFGTGRRFGPLRIDRCQFASRYLQARMQECGVPLRQVCVVNWGVDRDAYLCERSWRDPARRFLMAGQLSEHKGVHVGLEAFGKLVIANPQVDLHLSIAGTARDLIYESTLRSIVEEYNLGTKVKWLGKLDDRSLQKVYRSHDAFLFPSAWNEPFSIALVEAMSAGMTVVSTTTGGTGELLHDGENALVFNPGDSTECARLLQRISSDAGLCQRLSLGAEAATVSLTLQKMVDAIEQELEHQRCHTANQISRSACEQ